MTHPPLLTHAAYFLAASFVMAIRHSCRWQADIAPETAAFLATGAPFISCFWHERMMLAPQAMTIFRRPMAALSSGHKDGQIIGHVCRLQGIRLVSGSSHSNTTAATRTLIKALRGNTAVTITPDGPRGPRHSVTPGLIQLARISGAPLLPCSVATSGCIRLNTWDRCVINRPFSKGRVVLGPLINVGKADDPTTTATALANALCAADTLAEAF